MIEVRLPNNGIGFEGTVEQAEALIRQLTTLRDNPTVAESFRDEISTFLVALSWRLTEEKSK